jgi:hypothetical protein
MVSQCAAKKLSESSWTLLAGARVSLGSALANEYAPAAISK